MIDQWNRYLVSSNEILELIYAGIDPETLNVISDEKIVEYNHWCQEFYKLEYLIPPITMPTCTPEEEHKRRVKEWFIPQEYLCLDVRSILLKRCKRDDERERVNMEMTMFEERGLIQLLQLMFSLVDYFRKENIIWGVGRGSSCASYCLYLIGVHKIDCIRFDLPITEFLK